MTARSVGVRLQKFLAEAGLASRRKAEEMIQSGRVRVNGQVITALGSKVDPARDLVVVDGAPVERKESRRYLLLYKPPGCVTTLSDPQGRPTARGYLGGVKERVFPIGRLDYDAEGALLFTDDGDLANRLAHPSFGHNRVYLVKTKGDPDPAALRRLVEGVRLEDGPARALVAEIHEKAEKNTWVRLVVGEGRNHLVKRLCEAVGLPVLRLFRPEFGGVTVQRLRPGHWRDLTPEELEVVRAAAGLGHGATISTTLDPEALPRAARRHGHGPPSQGTASSQQPADRARDARRAQESEPAGRGRSGRPDGRSGRPARWSARPEGRPGRPEGRGGRPEGRGGRPEGRGGRPEGRGGRPEGRGGRPEGRGGRPEGRGGRPEGRGGRPEGRGDKGRDGPGGSPPGRPGRGGRGSPAR